MPRTYDKSDSQRNDSACGAKEFVQVTDGWLGFDLRDIVVTAPRQTGKMHPSISTPFRLSTEGLGDVAIPRASFSGGLRDHC